jgi:hypothetical protein
MGIQMIIIQICRLIKMFTYQRYYINYHCQNNIWIDKDHKN